MSELSYKNLDVWKKKIELVSEVYKLISKFPIQEQFGLTSHLWRAAISIPSNISEGAARSTKSETVRFLDIARVSLVELDTQIEVAVKLNHLSITGFNRLIEKINHSFAMLSKFIKSIKNNKRSD